MPASLYHTHAWVDITSAKNPKLAQAGRLPLLSLSDSASLDGTQTLSLTIAARAEDGTLWADLIQGGDLISIGAFCVEENGDVSSASLCVDAVVQDCTLQEVMQQGSYSMTTTITAQGLQSVIQQDAVAWWMFYGTQIGALRAKGELQSDDLSGRLDKVLANYMNKVALNFANWQRDDTSLKERLGYHFFSLTPNVPVLYNLSVNEGPHWDIMSQYAETSLHEFFVQQRAPNDGDRPIQGGFVHSPTFKASALLSSDNPGKHDGKRPYVVLRPKPFPYADKEGKPQMGAWNSLYLHSFDTAYSTLGQRGFTRSVAGVRNFVMVFPGYDTMNDQVSLTNSLCVVNPNSIKRYGFKPAKFRTNLVMNQGSQSNMLELARELTWRVASQMNRMDEMQQGSITVPLAPKVQAGDRVRFRLVLADGTPRGIYQGYVTGRTHQYATGQGGMTSINLERVLPDSVYQNPQWFVEGLERASLNWGGAEHSTSTPAPE